MRLSPECIRELADRLARHAIADALEEITQAHAAAGVMASNPFQPMLSADLRRLAFEAVELAKQATVAVTLPDAASQHAGRDGGDAK